MSDTGAPWELPYPLPTDLVRDGADAIKDLAEATATGLSAAGNAGIGSNVVTAVKTDTFTTTSTSYTTITGLSATITPTTNTSKILIIANVNVTIGSDASSTVALSLAGGNAATYIGGADGSRTRAATGHTSVAAESRAANRFTPHERSIVYVDSPATTSSTTYTVEISTSSGTVYVNRDDQDGDSDTTLRTASSITVIEVAP